MKSKLVAIAVPLYNRPDLTEDEEISLKHLEHFLGKYDKFFIAPKSLSVSRPGFRTIQFDNKFFGSAKAHTSLLFQCEFYEAFNDYEYLLIYHLDSLAFSDQLEEWCERGYDFIGPPWIKHKDAPYAGDEEWEGRVGNGGFALKRVESFLKVFRSSRKSYTPSQYWNKYHSRDSFFKSISSYPKKLVKYTKFYNDVRWELSNYPYNEEHFISHRASHYYSDFKIAPVDEALQFGFECVPEYCFELTDQKIPFGCHAWPFYNRSFWEPYLLK